MDNNFGTFIQETRARDFFGTRVLFFKERLFSIPLHIIFMSNCSELIILHSDRMRFSLGQASMRCKSFLLL